MCKANSSSPSWPHSSAKDERTACKSTRDFVSAHADAPYIYMECALLFEVGWQRLVDRTVLVSCPEEERIRRIMARDTIDRATACRWIALQMPEAEKARLADVVLINDGQAPILPQLEQYQLIPSSFSE